MKNRSTERFCHLPFPASFGSQERAIPRTWDRLLNILTKLNAAGQLPDLPAIFGRQAHVTTSHLSMKE
jgi:hypothetical protein